MKGLVLHQEVGNDWQIWMEFGCVSLELNPIAYQKWMNAIYRLGDSSVKIDLLTHL